DSFVWWAEAVRGDGRPEPDLLARRVEAIYASYRSFRFSRLGHTVGIENGVAGDRLVEAADGEAGHVLFGPYVPMKPGRGVVRFPAACGPASVAPGDVLAVADVATEATVVASKELTAEDLPPDGGFHDIALPFDLSRAEVGVQFRLLTTGRVRLAAFCSPDVDEVDHASAGESPPPLAAAPARRAPSR